MEIEHGKPLTFGKNKDKGIALDKDGRPQVVNVAEHGAENLLVHDEQDPIVSSIISRLGPGFPTPIGVFRCVERASYDGMMQEQIERAESSKQETMQDLLSAGQWVVE